MAKVLLTVPNSDFIVRDSLAFTSPPLGVGYIASYLTRFGKHEVKIHDGLLPHPRASNFVDTLTAFSPDLVGISGQTTPSIYDVYHTAKMVKHHNPSTPVIAGGAHVTFEDEQVLLDCPDIDVVVRGEGEVTMYDIVDRISNRQSYNNVLGTTTRNNGTIVRNPDRPYIEDLDSIPHPAYDILDLAQYFPEKFPIAPMITSRGCPYQCTFCSSSRITGKRWRGRSAKKVIEEVQLLRNNYGVRDVTFIDDLFTFDHLRVEKICSMMNQEVGDVTWTCSSRADIMSRRPEMANWLKAAGCHTLYVGAESGSQRILNRVKKGIRLNQIINTVKLAKRVGLQIVLSFILGIPGESKKDMQSTIDFACKLDPDFAQFTICTPYPGTPMYDEALENGWLVSTDWTKFTVIDPVMNIPDLPQVSIKQALTRAYLKFYTRPCLIWRQLKMRNFDFFKVAFRTIRNRYRK